MTQKLYQSDSYLKEFEAEIASATEEGIILDKSAFYPTGGGQPCDTGKLIRLRDNKEFQVTEVKKSENGPLHVIAEPGLQPGDKVRGIINWDRRYKLMRMHSAAHVLSAAVNKLTGALVTGKQLKEDESRIDFSLEDFDREQIPKLAEEANSSISKGAEVKTYTLPREEALKIPGMVKLAGRLPPSIPQLRIVEIKDVDTQACGGTHVKEIKEIGGIEVTKAQNKGASNRRLYYKLKEI